jgi:EpsI family protein
MNIVANPSASVRSRPIALLVEAAILGAICLVFYSPVVSQLVKEWSEHENFSYGFLIPFIFLYLVWDERTLFTDGSIRPCAWGAVSFLGAFLLGVLGKVAGEAFLSRVSLVLAIGSLVHLFWGWQCVKRLAFPLAYLFLMVPPPYVIVKEVSYHLRMFDASVADTLIQAVGVPVYRDAYFLHLPDITLEVADVCSGIASLFAMLALGTMYIYYLPTRLKMKFVVLAGVFVFPVIANLFRIFLVAVTVYYIGPVMLEAFFHRFTGTFTFLLSLAMLLSLGEVLRRKYPDESGLKADKTPSAKLQQPEDELPSKGSRGLAWPVSALVLVVGFVFYLSNSPAFSREGTIQVDLEKIPAVLGPYQVVSTKAPESYSDPHAERTLSRFYESPEKNQVELFVGYTSSQFDENRLRSPKLTFPRGWEYASLEEIHIPNVGTKGIDAAGLLTKKSDEKRFVLFWYDSRGHAFASDLRNRIELIKNFALHGRTDGAVIRLATPVSEFESVDAAKERLISFSQHLYPELAQILPK